MNEYLKTSQSVKGATKLKPALRTKSARSTIQPKKSGLTSSRKLVRSSLEQTKSNKDLNSIAASSAMDPLKSYQDYPVTVFERPAFSQTQMKMIKNVSNNLHLSENDKEII